MLYRAPGRHSSTALKLILINTCKDKSAICMCRSMNSRMLALCNVKKSYCNTKDVLTKEHSHVKDLEWELKDIKSHSQSEANTSVLLPMIVATAEPKSWVVILTWSLPQPEAGPSWLPPPQPEAGPSCLPLSRKEMRPASPPEEVNLGSHIAMEVDNEYDWLTEEASFKLVEGLLPVSKRQ